MASGDVARLLTRREFLQMGLGHCTALAANLGGLPETPLMFAAQASTLSPEVRRRLVAVTTWLRQSFQDNRAGYVDLMRQANRAHRQRGLPTLGVLEGFRSSLATLLLMNQTPTAGRLSPALISRIASALSTRLPSFGEMMDFVLSAEEPMARPAPAVLAPSNTAPDEPVRDNPAHQ